MIKTIIAAALLSLTSAASAQDLKMDDLGNVLVPIFYASGAVMCCCPAQKMKAIGPEWTDIYCAIPIKEYNRWRTELYETSGRLTGQGR